ncbi:MAG: ATP-binding protein [Desulfuromonadales bacterium]|nr:ATP-binding protein [Desulfuromonadales bacterium]
MFRIPYLRNLFVLALVATTCLPLYTLYVLHPAYHKQLIRETEEESVRFARYLVRSLDLEGAVMNRANLPGETIRKVHVLRADDLLIKLRFFSPHGEIIYSTLPEEIGRVNDKDYFRQIVAQGQVYSKVVRKDTPTADGQPANLDVVETYVPFAAAGQFGGAIEVYYDITPRVYQVNLLTLRTSLVLVGLAVVLMAAITLALRNAGRAETALRRANDKLETRVAERTRELQDANAHLAEEIAERAMAQLALTEALEETRAGREKLDGILRSVTDGLLVTDCDLRIMHMNDAAEKMLRTPLEKVLGQPVDSLPLSAGLLARLRERGDWPTGALSLDFALGDEDSPRRRVFQARMSQIDADDSLRQGVVLLVHDVTEEREIEQMKNAFLGMAAHELNTPLTVIIGYTELLADDDACRRLGPDQVRASLELIHVKAVALSRLVEDLLDISRIESGQALKLDCSQFSLNELIGEALQSCPLETERHSFELQCPDEPVLVHADRERLLQVITNLLSNAIKYSVQGGTIRIVLAADQENCRLAVVDQGVGMTSEQLQRAFDRFYRADSSNTAVQGVGLGLCVTRHIVEAHGGRIDIDSEYGQGSTVNVVLPRHSSAC